MRVEDYDFAPSALIVGLGTEVTWRNAGRADHTVTAEGDGAFDSGSLAPGAEFAHAFDRAGTYEYVCKVHPAMRGRVEVLASRVARPRAGPEPFPIERVAGAAIIGAPLLLAGAAFGLSRLRP